MLGMLGLIVSLGLLIYLTMKGINIIIAAILCAVLVALTGGLNLETALTDYYMTGFTSYFAWPTTELSENPYTNENQELNGKSELREHGYQITGMSTVKRWEVLEQAVPETEMGLRKIAYTIAFLVKSRKGQANGTVKFKYSITEWEKDLAMLKERYYKKDFTWPST